MKFKIKNKIDFTGAVIMAIVLIMLLSFAPKIAKADETSTLNDWFEKQYIEFIEYQKKGWEDGKNQLILNKEQIINMPETITTSLTQTFGDISNLFVSVYDTLNISITGILNDK